LQTDEQNCLTKILMSRSSLSARRLYRMENQWWDPLKMRIPVQWRWKANEGLSKDKFVPLSLRYTSYSDIPTLSNIKYQIESMPSIE